MQDGINQTGAANVLSALVNVNKKQARILEKLNPFVYPSSDTILVRQGTILSIFNGQWRSYEVDVDTNLTAANLDDGSNAFQVGVDYYIYLIDDGANGQLMISANSTFPIGQTASSSRKIGGFHYGHIRCTDSRRVPIDSTGVQFGANGTIWQNNVVIGIIDNSVWDLNNRPTCSPEGMVQVGNIWIDIYKASAAETVTLEGGTLLGFVSAGLLQSKYGQTPLGGPANVTWYAFNELASRSGKRMLSYAEWVRHAYGNPGSDGTNNYGWFSSAIVRTGCNVDNNTGLFIPGGGAKPFAISAYNTVDSLGIAWEYLTDLTIWDGNSTTFAWQNILGIGKGQLYATNNTGLRGLQAGSDWNATNNIAGARTAAWPYMIWASTNNSCRLACESFNK
jgi:hypothetical protein